MSLALLQVDDASGSNPISLTPPAGANLLIVAFGGQNTGSTGVQNPSAMTWAGTTVDKVVETRRDDGSPSDQSSCASLWRLKRPAAGNNQLAWTGGPGVGDRVVTAYWFAKARNVRSTASTTHGTAGSSITVAVTSKPGDICVLACGTSENPALTGTSGTTLDFSPANSGSGAGHESAEAGATTTGGFGHSPGANASLVSLSVEPWRQGGARYYG